MPQFVIRPATDKDAQILAAIHQNSIAGAFRGLLSDEYMDLRTPEQFLQLWQDYPKQPGATTYLAEDDAGTAVGFVAVRPSQDKDSTGWGELDRLYLEPTAWGHGLGARLLECGEQQLFADGYDIIKLWVFEKNERARSLYESRGYMPDSTAKKEHDETLLRYEKLRV